MNDNNSIPPDFERKIIRELALGTLKEKKTARRWGIFFKIWGLAVVS
jgi:hypothetical protein